MKSWQDSKPTNGTTDQKLDLDWKWSNQFNCVDALLLAKTLDKKTTFQTVKVAPSLSPPAGAVKSTQPFTMPTRLLHTLHQPLHICPAPTPLLESISLPANLKPTNLTNQDLSNQLLLNPLPLTDRPPVKTVSRSWSWRRTVSFPTDHL